MKSEQLSRVHNHKFPKILSNRSLRSRISQIMSKKLIFKHLIFGLTKMGNHIGENVKTALIKRLVIKFQLIKVEVIMRLQNIR